MPRPLETTYVSDVFPARALLATLVIFYDKVYLPHPYGVSWSSRKLWANWGGNFDQEYAHVCSKNQAWYEANQPYFQEGAVQFLPDVFEIPARVSEDVADELHRRFGIEHLNNYRFSLDELLRGAVKFSNSFILNGDLALALHFAYADAHGTEFIWEPDLQKGWEQLSERRKQAKKTATEQINALLLKGLLSYEAPLLNIDHPEEILALRQKHKEGREALRLVFSELADSVERRMAPGLDASSAAYEAIEREFAPKFEEFRRMNPVTRWSSLPEYVRGFVKIDATPFSPKFFMQLAEAFFGAAGALAKDYEKEGTNRYQAFNFLAKAIYPSARA